MKKLLLTFALTVLAASPPPMLAQVNGTITTASFPSCVAIAVGSNSTVAIQVTGSWSGTLAAQLSVQGQAAQNLQVVPSTAITSPQTGIAANGLYYAGIAGGTTFFVCGPTASGSATVYLNVSTGVSMNRGGSGGGGSMTWPSAAGIANYAGANAWGNSYNAGNAIPANFLPAALSSSTSINGTSIPASVTWPQSLANASHKWINSFNQSTGAYTQTQPASTDLSDYGAVSPTGLFGTTLIDFSGASQLKLPVAAGYASAANGEAGYDTTNKNWHAWQNAADSYLFSGPVSGTYTNNDCVKFSVVSGVITLVDNGSACGSGGSSAGAQNAIQYSSNGSGGFAGTSPPTTNGQYVCGYNVTASASVAPTCPLVGFKGRTVTGTSDTITYADAGYPVNYEGSTAVAVSLPTPTTLGNANFGTVLVNNTSGSSTAVTVTATTNTFLSTGTTTLTIAQGQSCKIYVDAANSAVWDDDCHDLPAVAGSNVTITRGQYGPTISASSGMSGMTAGQVPIAATATTVASSEAINGTDTKLQSGTGSFSATTIAVGDANGGVTPSTAGTNAIAAIGVSDTTFTNATTAISANSCSASAVTVTMTGVTTSMAFVISPSTDVSGATGWGSSGGLVIDAWPTANTLNYKICNQTANSITPAAVTWNVGVR